MTSEDIRIELFPVLGYAIVQRGEGGTLLARPFLASGERGEFECEIADEGHVLGIIPAIPGTFEVFAHFEDLGRGYVMGFEYRDAHTTDWEAKAKEALHKMMEASKPTEKGEG